MRAISARLRADGYGLLTLDQFAFVEQAGVAAVGASRTGQLVPPVNTPMFAEDMAGGAYKSKSLTRTWYIFFAALAKSASAAGTADLAKLVIFAPSIDEEDIRLYGTGSIDASTDPVSLLPASVTESSRYGTVFDTGDFLIWNDSSGYEIDQITGIGSAGELILQRREQGAPANQAHFGSPLGAHTSQTFYRLVPQFFTVDISDGVLPEMAQFPWANKCVAAVRTWGVSNAGQDGPAAQLNLAQTHVPGWRTMNGAEYTNLGIAGDLVVNQRAAYRVPVAAWESIRCVFASVKTPPTGASIKIAVVWIGPDDTEGSRPVGFIERLEIPIGSYRSFLFANPPDSQQLPYGRDFPPNLLANCGSLSGLTPPVSPGVGAPLVFSPDGEIDIVIEQVGSTTPGADLVVTVQT
jgi:hypothetical protein